jgi:hypothetical protein
MVIHATVLEVAVFAALVIVAMIVIGALFFVFVTTDDRQRERGEP